MPHFGVLDPEVEPDPQIQTQARFCTMHLATKFHRPNRSEVILLTNIRTNTQVDADENIHLCFAILR